MTKWFLEKVVLNDFEDWYHNQWGIKATLSDVRTFLKGVPSINHEKLVRDLYEAYSKKYDEEHM